LGTDGSINFGVTRDGVLYANGAHINGSGTFSGDITCNTITANGTGTIAGWYIDANTISKGNIKLDSYNGTISSVNSSGNTFSVNNNGEMTSNAGTIGGWTISKTELKSATGNVLLSNDGTISGGNLKGGTINIGKLSDGTYSFTVDSTGK
jgi:hypothetical protein